MPLSFLGAVLGWVALLWEGWVAMEGGRVEGAVWVPATFFAVLPGALLLVRWARGHFSRRLMA